MRSRAGYRARTARLPRNNAQVALCSAYILKVTKSRLAAYTYSYIPDWVTMAHYSKCCRVCGHAGPSRLMKVLFSISGIECKSASILSTNTGQTITNDNGHSVAICRQCSARLLSCYQHQQHAKEIREKVLNDFLGCVARTNVELANDTDSTYGHQAVSDGCHSGSPLAKRACPATSVT